jgi:sugar phosphate isomerase/epimerase
MNRLSLCQLTVETGPPPGDSMVANMLRLISAAAGAGFAAVVPRVRQPPGLGAASRNDDRPLHVEEVRRRLADTGIGVASVMSFWITPETVPAQFEASLDAAAGIGAHSIQVVCRDPDPGRSLANFSRTCAMARSRGLRVALEFMPYSSVRSLSEASAFLLRAGQKNAGLCVDALHFHRSGSSLGELQALDPAALVLVQFCDAPRAAPSADRLRDEARSGRLYPGQGELALHEFFDALPPGCLLDIEAPCAADAALSVEEKARNAAAAMAAFLAEHGSIRENAGNRKGHHDAAR